MLIATNKKVSHDYQILEKFEAGLVLSGPEVKSIKNGNINLKGSYIAITATNKPQLTNCYIALYPPAINAQRNYQPLHPRDILLTKKEINSLSGKLQQKSLTILPLSVYTKHGLIKMEIGLARGKKKYDKREEIKKRDAERRIQHALRKKV